jgi:uncharacterized membrane protein
VRGRPIRSKVERSFVNMPNHLDLVVATAHMTRAYRVGTGCAMDFRGLFSLVQLLTVRWQCWLLPHEKRNISAIYKSSTTWPCWFIFSKTLLCIVSSFFGHKAIKNCRLQTFSQHKKCFFYNYLKSF